VEVAVERASPDLDDFGALPATFVTSRYAVFEDGERTIVDYRGLAVGTIDQGGDRLTVRGEDELAVHEAVYYFLLGRIGAHLDRLGLVRVHGLGLAGEQGGVVVLLPSSGGKSTLALQLLGHEEGRLLSEESPLLDRHARLHPFPLRLAVGETSSPLVAPDGRTVPNPVTGEKHAVEVEAFADRVQAAPVPLRHIVIGRRSLGRDSRLEERRRPAALLPLVSHAVVGVGLHQGLGYAHQRGAGELAAKLLVAARRAFVCAACVRSARVWELTLGRDVERSIDALRVLLT
jgi:hypothetical protein